MMLKKIISFVCSAFICIAALPAVFWVGAEDSTEDTVGIVGRVKQVSLGSYHSAAVTEDGRLFTWGRNYSGELGNGISGGYTNVYDDCIDSSVPVKIMDNADYVEAGYNFCVALTKDRSLYTWGNNVNGQLGDGTSDKVRSVPTKILENVRTVDVNKINGAAITEDGSLYMCGNNSNGQLRNGTTENSYEPVKIMDGIASVCLGSDSSGTLAYSRSTAAITEDGDLYMWGLNTSGQLGNGTTEGSSVPIKIMENVVSVSLGPYHSAAITEDGSLYMWGANGYGRLGNGTTESSYEPIKVMDNVASVTLSDFYSAAITNDGSLYMWGKNGNGQLGNGTKEDSNTPVKIMDNVADVELSYFYNAAITEDGSLYTWGSNIYGHLGNGTKIDSNVPIKILDNVASVVFSVNHYCAAVATDGSLYTWGYNSIGQLGNGTTEDSSVPIKINTTEGTDTSYLSNGTKYDLNVYGEVLDMFYDNISNDWSGSEGDDVSYTWTSPTSEGGFSEATDLSKTGYQFLDINEDGIDELIVGYVSDYNGEVNIIDMYTVYDDDVVHLASKEWREVIRIGNDQKIYDYSYFGVYAEAVYYCIDEGKLKAIETYVRDTGRNSQNPFFYSDTPVLIDSNGFQYYKFDDMQQISEEEWTANAIDCVQSFPVLELQPFSSYVDQEVNEHLEWLSENQSWIYTLNYDDFFYELKADGSVNNYRQWKQLGNYLKFDNSEIDFLDANIDMLIAELLFSDEYFEGFENYAFEKEEAGVFKAIEYISDSGGVALNTYQLGNDLWDTIERIKTLKEAGDRSDTYRQLVKKAFSDLVSPDDFKTKNSAYMSLIGVIFDEIGVVAEALDELKEFQKNQAYYIQFRVEYGLQIEYMSEVFAILHKNVDTICDSAGGVVASRMKEVFSHLEDCIYSDDSAFAEYYNNAAKEIGKDVIKGSARVGAKFVVQSLLTVFCPELSVLWASLDIGVSVVTFIAENSGNIKELAQARDMAMGFILLEEASVLTIMDCDYTLKRERTRDSLALFEAAMAVHRKFNSTTAKCLYDFYDEKYIHVFDSWVQTVSMHGPIFKSDYERMKSYYADLSSSYKYKIAKAYDASDIYCCDGTEYTPEAFAIGIEAAYKILYVACPVNITVYNGITVAAEVTDDRLVYTDNTCLVNIIRPDEDSTAAKVITYPSDYTVEITGYADGEMNISKITVDSGTVVDSYIALDIPVKNGATYSEVIENSSAVQIATDLDNDGVTDNYTDVYRIETDSEFKLGDVNGDGMIDASDASSILQEYAALSTGHEPTFNESQRKAADVNSDGLIDASDASTVSQYYAYLSTGGSDSLEKFLIENAA